jgi:hypothetical protein
MATRGWETITRDQIAGAAAPDQPRKYRNVKVEIDGRIFDSRAEGDVYLKLRDRQAHGEIYRLQPQVAFPLFTAVQLHDERRKGVSRAGRLNAGWMRVQVCEYIADFVFFEAGKRHVVDVKRPATQTAVYKLKRKWLQLQDNVVIEEVAG